MSSRSIQIIGGDGRQHAYVDEHNNALVAMDEVHANVHRGVMFQLDRYAASIADDGTMVLLVQVAESQSSHMRFSVAAGGDTEIELFEGPTFSDAGTALTPLNRNRFSGNSAATTISHTPTVSDDGTELSHLFIPGGSGFLFTPGGTGRSFKEWVLATSTSYLFRVTNRAGTAQPMSVSLDFYEPQ